MEGFKFRLEAADKLRGRVQLQPAANFTGTIQGRTQVAECRPQLL
jgi:hypothetical protein